MFLLCFYGMAIIVILYAIFDVHYFVRVLLLYIWVKIVNKKKKLLDTTMIYGICTTQDIDLVLTHMNNARYLRELDFGRFYYYNKTGLYKNIIDRGYSAFQTASIVRYRRSIIMFTPYKVTTKLIYWDNRHFYMEHRFVSFTNNFVYATVLTRQTLTTLKISVHDVLVDIEPEISKPKPTKELQHWVKAIEESSQSLRQE